MITIKQKFPSYSVFHRGDPEYEKIFKHLHTTPEGMNGLTVIETQLPSEVPLSDREFLVARYSIDQIMTRSGQVCLSLDMAAADADVFFNRDRSISGLQQVHAMAHLLLAHLAGDITTPLSHVSDSFLTIPNDPAVVFVVLTVPLRPEDGLHDLIVELWASFRALLTGSIEGRVAELLFGAL